MDSLIELLMKRSTPRHLDAIHKQLGIRTMMYLVTFNRLIMIRSREIGHFLESCIRERKSYLDNLSIEITKHQ